MFAAGVQVCGVVPALPPGCAACAEEHGHRSAACRSSAAACLRAGAPDAARRSRYPGYMSTVAADTSALSSNAAETPSVGMIGWRGMVGSVLVDRMLAE